MGVLEPGLKHTLTEFCQPQYTFHDHIFQVFKNLSYLKTMSLIFLKFSLPFFQERSNGFIQILNNFPDYSLTRRFQTNNHNIMVKTNWITAKILTCSESYFQLKDISFLSEVYDLEALCVCVIFLKIPPPKSLKFSVAFLLSIIFLIKLNYEYLVRYILYLGQLNEREMLKGNIWQNLTSDTHKPVPGSLGLDMRQENC